MTTARGKMTAGLAAAAFCLSLAPSCDDPAEDFSWRSWRPGMVYNSNGRVTTCEEAADSGYAPAAVLFHVGATGAEAGIAYAVSLNEASPAAFCDSVYGEQGTSADITALDGERNTAALRYAEASSPLANGIPPKYFIPSVGEMYKLYAAREAVNAAMGKCGGTPLPSAGGERWYWTSTECAGEEKDRAWRFSLHSGRFESMDKHAALPARPIMTIRLNGGEQDSSE